MKSKKKPLWLTFKNADPLGDDIVVMLKCGDDLRMDMVTLQLFQAMQTLWFDGGLNLKMTFSELLGSYIRFALSSKNDNTLSTYFDTSNDTPVVQM